MLAKNELGRRNTNPEKQLAKLKTALEDVQLDITATVGKQSASLRNILNLSPGDIIPLNQMMDADVYVGNKLFKKAKVNADNGKLLLLIEDDPSTMTQNVRIKTEKPEQEADDNNTEQPPARRRRNRSSRNTDSADTATQTRSERREARQSNRNTTATRGA